MTITTTETITVDEAERVHAEIIEFAGCWEALQQLEADWTAGPDRDGHTRRMIQHLSRRTRRGRAGPCPDPATRGGRP